MSNETPTTPNASQYPDPDQPAAESAGEQTRTLPPEPEQPGAQQQETRPRLADRVFGLKSLIGVALATLIVGGLAGFGLGKLGGDDHRDGFGRHGGPGRMGRMGQGQPGQMGQGQMGQGGPQGRGGPGQNGQMGQNGQGQNGQGQNGQQTPSAPSGSPSAKTS